jgi:hypothetical protein
MYACFNTEAAPLIRRDAPRSTSPQARQEVLVAFLRAKVDFAILKELGWYRIPVEHAPGR